jgi:hypothetical protein
MPAVRWLRQEDHKFKDSLNYITRPCLKKNRNINFRRRINSQWLLRQHVHPVTIASSLCDSYRNLERCPDVFQNIIPLKPKVGLFLLTSPEFSMLGQKKTMLEEKHGEF